MQGRLTVSVSQFKFRAIEVIALFLIVLMAGCSAPIPEQTDSIPSFTASPTSPSAAKTAAVPVIIKTPTPEPATSTQITTAIPGSITPSPSSTESAGIAVGTRNFIPQVGGADRIAFIESNEIWQANLDGTALTQLTEDGNGKTSLQWSPDGEKLFFISGRCIRYVDYASFQVNELTCFGDDQELNAFQISPDGSLAAISVNYDLYVIPFDPLHLSQASTGADLARLGSCASLSPYKHRQSMVRVIFASFSHDGRRMAILRQAFENGEEIEIVHIIDISRCQFPPPRLEEFPASRIEMENYLRTPILQGFAWDGGDLFALTDFKRNDGYGDLWIYNSQLHQGYKANPIDGKCCYRDPVFSPDGNYLAFVFQDASQKADEQALVYLIPYAALDSSLVYPQLALPGDFFTARRAKPEPALRPAN